MTRITNLQVQPITSSKPIKVLCLVPAFHGHARPMWQLACELHRKADVECVFVDCFSEALNYSGEVPTHRIPTKFNESLVTASQDVGATNMIVSLTQSMADYYTTLQAPLLAFAQSYQADIIITDYFFSLGPALAKAMNIPHIVAYSSPDIFYIDQDKQNQLSMMEVMMELKKFTAYRDSMLRETGMELHSFSFSPYGNICFSPDIMKLKNPKGFLEEDFEQDGVRWLQYHSFFDNKVYPLAAVNHAAICRDPDDDDRDAAAFLSDPHTTSLLISFGTVWMRQLGDEEIIGAFVNLLRGVLIASNHASYRILYSGDASHIEQAMAGLDLRSKIVCKPYINQSYLVGFADVFVFHGGHNSFCEAMAARTPMLIFPKGFDQGRIADLATHLGVGERISFTKNTPQRIEAKLKQLTEEPRYHERLQEESAHFATTLDIDYVYLCIKSAIAHYPQAILSR